MGWFLTELFTWWNGQTMGTRWFTRRKGEKVGTDEFGNTYYRTPDKACTAGGFPERRGEPIRVVEANAAPERQLEQPADGRRARSARRARLATTAGCARGGVHLCAGGLRIQDERGGRDTQPPRQAFTHRPIAPRSRRRSLAAACR